MEKVKETKCAIYISAEMKYSIPIWQQISFLSNIFDKSLQNECELKYPSPVLVDTYIDRETKKRSLFYRCEFKRMIEDAKSGKFDVVFCLSYTALAKAPIKAFDRLESIAKDIEPHTLTFEFIIERISTNDDYKIALAFEQAISYEHSRKNKLIFQIKKAQLTQEVESILKESDMRNKNHRILYSYRLQD